MHAGCVYNVFNRQDGSYCGQVSKDGVGWIAQNRDNTQSRFYWKASDGARWLRALWYGNEGAAL